MEAIGQLAGGWPMTSIIFWGVILGYCEVLEEQDLTQPTCEMIVEIHNAGSSAKSLTQHLLAFSRRQVLQPVVLDLNKIVNRVDTMLGSTDRRKR
jgi:two-component system, cell cycle sensor histidine kinase and response regulator CckA